MASAITAAVTVWTVALRWRVRAAGSERSDFDVEAATN
jgi:hypothetical protein